MTLLDTLDSQLQALAAAVESSDFTTADALMADHASQLAGLDIPRLAPGEIGRLHGVIQAQQALVARMLQLRDEAAAHLKQGKRSLRAAHAYLQAESLS